MLYNMQSENSNELSAFVGAGGAVSDVSATLTSTKTSCILSWTKSQDPAVVSYSVYYAHGVEFSGSFDGSSLSLSGDEPISAVFSPINIPVSSLQDSNAPAIELFNLIMDVPYWFKIGAKDAENESALVDMIGNLTPTESGQITLTAPSNIKMIFNRTNNSIMFTWAASE